MDATFRKSGKFSLIEWLRSLWKIWKLIRALRFNCAAKGQQPFYKGKQNDQVYVLGNKSSISVEGGGCVIIAIIFATVMDLG